MKITKHLVWLLLLCIGASNSYSQTPGGINYQGVARDQYRTGLNTRLITLRFSVRKSAINGTVIYTETRDVTTDSFGVFSVVIGSSGATSQSTSIKQVNWSDTSRKFLQVELDTHEPFTFTPGLLDMGTIQLMSVPFSFYSDVSDSSRVAAGSGTYFFSATIPMDYFQDFPATPNMYTYYVIKFPQVLYNAENKYNASTSTFTAPEIGFYQFNVNLYDVGNHLRKFVIMKNNNILVTKIVELEEPHHNKQIILKLLPGDQISVRVLSRYNNGIQLGWDTGALDDFEGNSSLIIDPTVFAEFSGYKIK